MTTNQRRSITLDQFRLELKLQGMPSHEYAMFVCPICRTVQCAKDLISAGAGKTFDEVEPYLGFSCVGRFTNAGPHKKGDKPGKGCNWTLGGLFQIHVLEVITPDGEKHPRFEIASGYEAEEHLELIKRGLRTSQKTPNPLYESITTAI
jgi:hypothetical protein